MKTSCEHETINIRNDLYPSFYSLRVAADATSCGLSTHIVRDAGRTQIAPGSNTILCIGPGKFVVLCSI